MAYVEPNSTIQIFKNVPLDASYRHSFWFTSLNEQDGHFGTTYYGGYAGITFPENSYTRKARGYVRLNIKPDLIIAYNYMRYKNINHGNKWYYAFITSVDYVNENTAEISFELDLIQTYMFDVVIRDSVVERQHNLTDNVGDNLVTENIPIGTDYFVERHGDIINLIPDRMLFIISKSVKIQMPDYGTITSVPQFSIINSYPAKISLLTCKMPTTSTEAEDISTLLRSYFSVISDDDIVGVFCYNHILDELVPFASQSSTIGGNYTFTGSYPTSLFKVGAVNTDISSASIGIILDSKFGGYTAKNNKMKTYPYKYLVIENGSGDSQELKYEMFSDHTFSFNLRSAMIPKPCYLLFPKSYASSIDAQSQTDPYPIGYDYGLDLNVETAVPFATDTFKGYLLSNRGTRTMAAADTMMEMYGMFAGFGSFKLPSMIQQNRTMGGQFASGFNVNGLPVAGKNMAEAQRLQYGKNIQSLDGSFSALKGMLTDDLNAKGYANGFKGSLDGDVGALVGADRYKFEYNQVRIKEENARIIDDYFTMYGYAQKKLMGVLSPSSANVATKNARRPYFNYTKTVGCNVFNANFVNNKIGCPSDDLVSIASIYDNGITFWNKDAQVGNYTYNNAPSTP